MLKRIWWSRSRHSLILGDAVTAVREEILRFHPGSVSCGSSKTSTKPDSGSFWDVQRNLQAKNSSGTEIPSVNNEISQYRHEPANMDIDPLYYWKETGRKYPSPSHVGSALPSDLGNVFTQRTPVLEGGRCIVQWTVPFETKTLGEVAIFGFAAGKCVALV